jgi:hypothetical protein
MIKLYSFFKEFFIEGGIEIITPSIARTVIQPDADVITYISEKAVAEPRLIKQHVENIRSYLLLLHSLKTMVMLVTPFMVLGFITLGYMQYYESVKPNVTWSVILYGFALYAIKGIVIALRYFIKYIIRAGKSL